MFPALLLLVPLAALPEPPFRATVTAPEVNVRARPDGESPVVGLLKQGAVVTITSCSPSCEKRGAWGLLGEDGAVRLSWIAPVPADQTALPPSTWLYGMVRTGGAQVYARADERSRTEGKLPARLVAVLEEMPEQPGWLRRPGGGFVQRERFRIYTPSPFQGVHAPTSPIAFLRTDTVVKLPEGFIGPAPRYPHLSHFQALEVSAARVRTEVGTFPRSAVGLAWSRPRPEELPSDARWVHISLPDQVLTAYEGDRWVFATLVSTGIGPPKYPTRPGTFRVWFKLLHERMHGDDYTIEEVPDILYFDNGKALHGALWHDHFGHAVSHGCVNLSQADARWLFQWAPPPMPEGWHSVRSRPGGPALWVVVDDHEAEPPLPGPVAGAVGMQAGMERAAPEERELAPFAEAWRR